MPWSVVPWSYLEKDRKTTFAWLCIANIFVVIVETCYSHILVTIEEGLWREVKYFCHSTKQIFFIDSLIEIFYCINSPCETKGFMSGIINMNTEIHKFYQIFSMQTMTRIILFHLKVRIATIYCFTIIDTLFCIHNI